MVFFVSASIFSNNICNYMCITRYTVNMQQYLRQVFPPVFFEKPQYFRALSLGGIYLLLIILQLFTFEKFYPIVAAFDLPGGTAMAVFVTGLIPVLEVAALPFLLSMTVSRPVWLGSRVAAVASPLVWLLVMIWLSVTGNTLVQVGIFGATIPLFYGWWVFVLCVMLLASAIIVARELPQRHA